MYAGLAVRWCTLAHAELPLLCEEHIRRIPQLLELCFDHACDARELVEQAEQQGESEGALARLERLQYGAMKAWESATLRAMPIERLARAELHKRSEGVPLPKCLREVMKALWTLEPTLSLVACARTLTEAEPPGVRAFMGTTLATPEKEAGAAVTNKTAHPLSPPGMSGTIEINARRESPGAEDFGAVTAATTGA